MRLARFCVPGALLMIASLVIAGCSSGVSGRVTVAAAADLRYALDEIVELERAENPEVEYAVTYGSSGQFLQQIENGAPFDLYLSADVAYPQQLVDSGRASDPFPYAIGRLVLWVPERSDLDPDDGLAILTEAARIAIANPEHAPYGRAAVSAMESAGVYDAVESRLVLGENVAQAAEFVMTGNADAGIVALSLVLSDPLRNVGSWSEIPTDTFPTIEQGGVLLSDSPEARALRDAINGPDGRAILARYGFTLPED
ncbi:MAG: molybdate transporter substrate-binding protein [Actinomycetota bacterium]